MSRELVDLYRVGKLTLLLPSWGVYERPSVATLSSREIFVRLAALILRRGPAILCCFRYDRSGPPAAECWLRLLMQPVTPHLALASNRSCAHSFVSLAFMNQNLTIPTSGPSHDGHLYARFSVPLLSGSTYSSHISAPHRVHLGRTIGSDSVPLCGATSSPLHWREHALLSVTGMPGHKPNVVIAAYRHSTSL